MTFSTCTAVISCTPGERWELVNCCYLSVEGEFGGKLPVTRLRLKLQIRNLNSRNPLGANQTGMSKVLHYDLCFPEYHRKFRIPGREIINLSRGNLRKIVRNVRANPYISGIKIFELTATRNNGVISAESISVLLYLVQSLATQECYPFFMLNLFPRVPCTLNKSRRADCRRYCSHLASGNNVAHL